MPIGVEANFKGVVDLLSMKAYLYEGDSGKFAEGEVPGDLKGAAEEMRQKLMESVSKPTTSFWKNTWTGKSYRRKS